MKFPLGNDRNAGWMWWFNLSLAVTSTEERGIMAKKLFERHVEMMRSWREGYTDSGEEMRVEAGESKYGGAWTDKGVWMGWDEVCGEWNFVGRGGCGEFRFQVAGCLAYIMHILISCR